MIQGWAVIATAFIYLLALFAVASYGDKRQRGRRDSSRPNIYAFTLAIYCTTWTFFGSVGLAASNGLGFLPIYIGPILLITLGFPLVRRIVRLSKEERITSVADFLGARYGKSVMVAAVATLIAVVGTVPYIALQLKAVSTSVIALISHYGLVNGQTPLALGEISVLIAVILAVFTILFGTRHADATEHQDGLMLAVAVESVVKLAAFLCVGVFVTFIMFGGPVDLYEKAMATPEVAAFVHRPIDVSNFLILTLLSFLVFLLLPRQFHVAVVENHSEKELLRARWLFPAYLVAINLFVVPIAAAGIVHFGSNANADLFVLSLPTSGGSELISMFAFIGGLSAGAAMVVVACVALAIMISNDLILPLILRRQERSRAMAQDSMEPLILKIRRTAIIVVMILGYAYFRTADNSQALAAIGLVSFAAVVQLAPAFLGGLVWQGANARGAVAGMVTGFCVWGYTLLMPTLLPDEHWLVAQGLHPSGILRPGSILGLGVSPIENGVIWSLALNTLAFVIGSLTRLPTNSENAQASVFVDRRQPLIIRRRGVPAAVTVAELTATVGRYLGLRRTQRSFESFWAERGERPEESDPVDPPLLRFSEQLLASAIGASSSRLVHTLLLKRFEAATPASIRLLDQASEALQYNRDVLQSALDQMDQGISVFDPDFRLAFWNRRFRRLLSLPANIGQVGVTLNEIAAEIVAVHDLAGSGIDGDSLADKIVNQSEPWLLALSASERIVEIRTSPMPGGGVVVTWHDITERILVAEALREANETLERRVEERTSELVRANRELARATRAADEANASKTRFLAAAGHDILQPLNAARLYASTLHERIGESADARLVANIAKSLESVEEILSAVLAISRLDTGRQETKITGFPIARIFEQMEVEFAPFARERGLDLRIVQSSAWVRSDPALLRRLLQNLISNAIKYTPRGRVLVGCRRAGTKVRIEIIDTGIGIARSDQRHIFTEFRRLDDGARQAPGLGLGLSIVERIAKVLSIDVALNSLPGKGTRFAITVPRAKAQEMAGVGAASGPAGRVGVDLKGIFVLCIDNDVSILEGMAGLLTQWGCEVATATDLDGAFAALAAAGRGPDIVLADYHLEAETGIDVIRAVRRTYSGDLPCALVTANRTQSLRSQAESERITVLFKPVKPAALRSVLSLGQTRRVAAE